MWSSSLKKFHSVELVLVIGQMVNAGYGISVIKFGSLSAIVTIGIVCHFSMLFIIIKIQKYNDVKNIMVQNALKIKSNYIDKIYQT